MGDENQPSKKRAAGRELSRDNPGLDDEEVEVQEVGTFKKASDEVLATRKVVKPRRQQSSTSSAPSTNPFAGIRLVPQTEEKVKPEDKVNESTAEPNADEEKDCSAEQGPAVTSDIKDKAAEENVNSEEKVKPEEKVNDSTVELNVDEEKECPTDRAAEPGPVMEREAHDSSEKTQTDANKIENEKSDASGNGGAPLSSFQQLSNTQNAFTGLTGTGFSSSTFSFGSLQKDGSPQSSIPTFSFGAPNNGSPSTPLFGSVMAGTSIGTKTEEPTFRSLQEVPTETGEENEETVFSSESALFEFLNGGWKERGKGEVKVNVLNVEPQKARLVMRAKGNLRLILNASLFPDMKLTKMDKKGVTFPCVNIANDSKDGLSTFALKFKDSSVVEVFSSAVETHKGKPTTATATATAIKTPENSP